MDVDLSELYIEITSSDGEPTTKESPVDIAYSVAEEIPDKILEVYVFLLRKSIYSVLRFS